MASFKKVLASKSILENVERVYANYEVSHDDLQGLLVKLVEEMTAQDENGNNLMSKKDVKEHPALVYMFKNAPRGIDRGTLAGWWQKVSPLKIVFEKKTAHFEGVTWTKKGEWNLDLARSLAWGDADPERTRELKKPDLDKSIDTIAIQAAKLAHITELSVSQVAERLIEKMGGIESLIKEKYSTDKVLEFKDSWIDQQNEKRDQAVH